MQLAPEGAPVLEGVGGGGGGYEIVKMLLVLKVGMGWCWV